MTSLDHLIAAARPWRATSPVSLSPEMLATRVLAQLRHTHDFLRPWWTGGLIAVAGASAVLILTFLPMSARSAARPITEPMADQMIRSLLIP